YTFQGGMDYRLNKHVSLAINGRYYEENQSYEDEITQSDGTKRRLYGDEFQQDYSIAPELSVSFGSVQLFEATAFLSRFGSESTLDYSDDGTSYFFDAFNQTLNKFDLK